MHDLLETTDEVVGKVVAETVESIADVAGEALAKGAVVAAAASSRWRLRGATLLVVLATTIAVGLLMRRKQDRKNSSQKDSDSHQRQDGTAADAKS